MISKHSLTDCLEHMCHIWKFRHKSPIKNLKNYRKAFQGSLSIKGSYNNAKVNNSKTPLRITRDESSRVLAIQFQLHWHYLLTNTRGVLTRTGRTSARDGSHSDTGWQDWYDMRLRLWPRIWVQVIAAENCKWCNE